MGANVSDSLQGARYAQGNAPLQFDRWWENTAVYYYVGSLVAGNVIERNAVGHRFVKGEVSLLGLEDGHCCQMFRVLVSVVFCTAIACV